MNKTDTPTMEKIMLPLRLPPKTYEKMMDRVQAQKKSERGYSVNQFLTELIEEELNCNENEVK